MKSIFSHSNYHISPKFHAPTYWDVFIIFTNQDSIFWNTTINFIIEKLTEPANK